MKANYGIDAPTVVRNMFLIGLALVVAGILVHRPDFSPALISPGATFLIVGGVMFWGSKLGKLKKRDEILDALALKGDEKVLDVGCGRGLMLIGAARRLKAGGKATGIDLWQEVDQSGNSADATIDNAKAERVAERVEVVDGDARQMPFADATFDVVLSSWALHNIPNADGRSKAIDEIVRVLRPGGKLAVVDIQKTAEYEARLKELGMQVVQVSPPNFLFVIPSRTVTAVKPTV